VLELLVEGWRVLNGMEDAIDLEALEAGAVAGAAQIDLFAAVPAPEEPVAEPSPASPPADSMPGSAVVQALAGLDPDSLSPREALAALYRLKGLSKEAS
jgi:DNA mismatch repair protein MutS